MKSTMQLFATILVLSITLEVNGVYRMQHKMTHQICNYLDLTEFLAPICTTFYGRRFRKDVKHSSSLTTDSKQALNFLKSTHYRRSRRAASRDVSYFEECCSTKICSFQELFEYCTVIPFHRLLHKR